MRYPIFLLICFMSSASVAASFDCGKAGNVVEKAICGDGELSRLDDQLARRFQALRESLPQEEAAQLRQGQINWIKERNRQCKADTACLIRFYTERLAHLNNSQAVKTEGGFTHLSKFNDEKYHPYYDALMQDKVVQRALKNLMGTDYKKYRETTARIEIGEPLVGPDGILRVYGATPHAYTIAETALVIKPGGAVYVAVLEEGKHVLYYTNDKLMTHKLPREFVEWSSRFSSLPIVYRSR